MLIDCDTCRAPDGACRDCVVTVLLNRGGPSVDEPLEVVGPVELDEVERVALGNLALVGLVPPLRLLSDMPGSSRDIA
jgi:hypothetical protein